MPTEHQPERYDQFAELMQEHYSRVYGYILALVRDFSDTEDLLQETSITLWQKFDEFTPGTNFGTWACQIAKFKVMNFLRTQRARSERFSESFEETLAVAVADSPAEPDDERHDALGHCVETLSEQQQELLWAYYGGDLTFAELAEKQGRTEGGLYGSIRHIRRRLVTCVQHYLSREAGK